LPVGASGDGVIDGRVTQGRGNAIHLQLVIGGIGAAGAIDSQYQPQIDCKGIGGGYKPVGSARSGAGG